MRIGLLTREYPPEVYGGAGVHVGFLVPRLRELIEVDVHAFGAPRADAHSHVPAPGLEHANAALRTLSVDLAMTAATEGVDLLHSHTWYANMAGHLGKILHGVPHVVTAHSLEPRRPWKAEQLKGGYRLSSWVERTAYEAADAIVAVSEGMRTDVLDCYPALDPARVHVVRNGIDTNAYHPVTETDALEHYGIDPNRPIVAFVGRITRQKGVGHLIAAGHSIDPDAQLVLCAGAPDTPEIAEETKQAVSGLAANRPGVYWIQQMLQPAEVRQILSHATAFVCPSVYEPLGIVNLEAMACGTAVVASDVGGIPEVVTDGRTGLLVHYDEHNVEDFRAGLAAKVNELVGDPARAAAMGEAGRDRAVRDFAWSTVAQQTVDVYRSVLPEGILSE
ncbi:glycogen synthase [Kibdelosporangium phytohabitans]|uniref:Glycosyl transferase family 1 n=1 Tax=Kibdelosporangium phytohabitans TaxID=860235 RepID=A0A0N9HX37_9PSEU|nr:glycogen synthase [Kibdelosporangium phytohabitans]ALG06672.1 glycosyl transferase family 1 [Kibdelosporangium phytohabitans]MBE1467888.1 starch synthase [Kibdelosporangium phytohabitans]